MASEIVVIDGKVLHLGLAKGQLAENVFLVGDPARAVRVADRFEHILCEVKNREYVTITGSYNGMPVSVIGTGIGVDNVEIALVEAYTVHAFDFDTSEYLSGHSAAEIYSDRNFSGRSKRYRTRNNGDIDLWIGSG